MRAVFVNYIHPETQHVSGQRVSFFARSLARQGHRIVLLTKGMGFNAPGSGPTELPTQLMNHDWRVPFHIACPPQEDAGLEKLRGNGLPVVIRKSAVVLQYTRNGGMFSDWTSATRRYWIPLAEAFRPQVVWGTFGNTDTWIVAQGVARAARCPWVADLKDGWEEFIPWGLRTMNAMRFRDAVAMTANSRRFAAQGATWFLKTPRVVYSGVAAPFLEDEAPPRVVLAPRRLCVVGSLYDERALGELLQGINTWVRGLDENVETRIEVVYAGTDAARFRNGGRTLNERCRVVVHDYLPLADLAGLCRQASMNLYIRNRRTFHHKLLELLACGRPVLAFPGESEEAIELAKRVQGRLLPVWDSQLLPQAITQALAEQFDGMLAQRIVAEHFSWDVLARNLAEYLESVSLGS